MTRNLSIRKAALVAASVFLALGIAATPNLRADDADAPQQPPQQQQPPARAVRLSYVDGTVSITLNGQQVTDKAVANTPLFQGMTVAAGDDDRAEIQFEDGSVARLSPSSSLTLKVLRGDGTNAVADLSFYSGLAYFEIQNSNQSGVIHVKSGDAQVTTSGFTVLRISNDTPPGELAVFSGNAHLDRSTGLSVDLHGGESVALTTGNVAESIEPDSWDAWNSDRDQALTAEAASQTSAPEGVGGGNSNNPAWNDLDANGNWYNVPDEGYVWSPYDAADEDFDPYGNGSWIYSPGYGYTWASAYSWGYMPFQCGAWNFYGGFGWGWAPGAGGCSPWWGAGYYGGPRYGHMPFGYRPVRRPISPHRPYPGRPIPMIAVNRRNRVITAGLPPRDRSAAVAINGHTLEALRPEHTRQAYEHAAFGNRPATEAPEGARIFPAPARPGYTPEPQHSSGFVSASGRTYTPAPSSGARSIPAPVHTYAPPASHSASGGSYHPSSGGGGFHSSGGGGGGASHSGGGGGGGHR